MSHPAATKNAALDGLTFTQASLHTGYPGTTGANEVTGGTYARKNITMNAAAGGTRALNAAVTFDVPASTIRFIGFWNAGTFIGYAPNGGATPKNFVNVASTDLIHCPSHGFSDTQKIVFLWGTAPGGLTTGTVYYVRDSATDTFKVAATSGGSAIDLTSASSSGCWLCAITEDVYAVAGTHELSTASWIVPD